MTLQQRLSRECVVLADIDLRRACDGDPNVEVPIPAMAKHHPPHAFASVEHAMIQSHLRDLEKDCMENPPLLTALERAACDLSSVAKRIREHWKYQQ